MSKLSISKEQAQWIVQNRQFRSLSELLGKKSGSSGSSSGASGRTSRLDDLRTIPALHTDRMIASAGQSLIYTQPLLLAADEDTSSGNRPESGQTERRGSRTGPDQRRGGRRPSEGGSGGGRPAGGASGSAGGSAQTETQGNPLDWATFSRIFDQVTLTNRSMIDGVINVNTVSIDVLRAFLEDNDELAGKIISYRESMGGEITNVCDLLNVEGMTQEMLIKYIDQFSVRSSVYLIQVTATSSVSGVSYTTEMVVNRDRQGREVLYRIEGIGN